MCASSNTTSDKCTCGKEKPTALKCQWNNPGQTEPADKIVESQLGYNGKCSSLGKLLVWIILYIKVLFFLTPSLFLFTNLFSSKTDFLYEKICLDWLTILEKLTNWRKEYAKMAQNIAPTVPLTVQLTVLCFSLGSSSMGLLCGPSLQSGPPGSTPIFTLHAELGFLL